jgi:phosphopantothenoylcysteine decarboxylase/phosphopantothenate--cysteine ligase
MVAAEKRNILLGVTGSIAAYKSVELARMFVSRGYEVRVVMSNAATKFVAPLTFQSVTGKAVMTDMWENNSPENIEHIESADWADVFVVAPATADFIAKLRYGHADSHILATALATKAPILLAPAMNVNMYENIATQENIEVLKKRGVSFVDPEEGALACGWNGQGRLADLWDIFYHTRRALINNDFANKKVLVTTGPTREAIDPVRFISNRSSGKMGLAIAREAFCRGANVTVVHGPVKELDLPSVVETVSVDTAIQMHDEVLKRAFDKDNPFDFVIMVAAVADFRAAEVSDQKIKKGQAKDTIQLIQNPDILASLGEARKNQNKPTLIGFAVETGENDALIEELRRKIETKGIDLICGNLAQDAFDLDTNRVWLVHKNGKQEEISSTFKWRVANKVLDAALKV